MAVKPELAVKPASAPLRTAQAHGDDMVRSRGFEVFARSGFVARAAIYGIIGVLALKLALGDGAEGDQPARGTRNRRPSVFWSRAPDRGCDRPCRLRGVALRSRGDRPWPRGARQWLRPCQRGSQRDRVRRVLRNGRQRPYGSGSSQSGNPHKTTAGVLGWPAGPGLVAAAGGVFLGVALYQGYKGITKKFLEDSKTEQMSPGGRRAFTAVGVVGHLSRMVVFGTGRLFLGEGGARLQPQLRLSGLTGF